LVTGVVGVIGFVTGVVGVIGFVSGVVVDGYVTGVGVVG